MRAIGNLVLTCLYYQLSKGCCLNDVVRDSTQVTVNKHTKYCNPLLYICIKDFERNALHTAPFSFVVEVDFPQCLICASSVWLYRASNTFSWLGPPPPILSRVPFRLS